MYVCIPLKSFKEKLKIFLNNVSISVDFFTNLIAGNYLRKACLYIHIHISL